MICSSCGSENPPDQKFCGECGTRLSATCPNCGATNAPGQKFCGECGTALATSALTAPIATGGASPAGASPAGASPAGASPAGAVSAGAGSAGRSERRLVSVLFADLVGFTPFAEEKDAEDVRDTLTRYFEVASDVIGRYGGVVEKFIGDAVMAVWGTPTAREDDAERAVRAGLDLVDAVNSLGPGIQARCGVLTGEVAVALDAQNQGMVAGDIVNTAARLQAIAPPGSVLVGEATHRAASLAIAFEEAGPQVLKGKSSPVPAWHALRVVAQRGGQGRTDMPEPPFVGRDEELRLLKEVIHTSQRDPRTRLVSVIGPGGIGKSRLAWELEKYIDGLVESVYWHRGRSPAYGDGITFWALGEMIRRRAGLAETDDEPTTRTRIRETVEEFVADPADRRWVEPALLTLLGLEPPPAGGRDVLFAAWRIFFERIAERGTTILLFEDLQWADSGLLDFIDHLVDWSKGVPIVVVTLARPELYDKRPDWGAARRNFTSITLEPLADGEMRELLAGFVPGLPETAIATILGRAEGVPLYAVETVRALVADGRIAEAGGTYRPVGDLGELAIPETLRSLIASRLDALDATDRALLQDAAVLGQVFTLAGLAAVTGHPEDELERRLRGFIRRELLSLQADPRSPERGQYAFVQALIREVAYGTLARRDRRARHLAVARFFESLGEDELAGALATHYLAAHEASAEGAEADAVAAQARIALRAASERASGLGAHEQALAYLRQALEITSEATDRADLLLRAAAAADQAGQYVDGEAFATEAVATFRQSGHEVAAGRARSRLGTIVINGGAPSRAASILQDAAAGLPQSGADDVRAEILATLSRALFRSDRLEEAIVAADEALPFAERQDLVEVVTEAFINKGAALSYLGRRREAAALYAAAIDLARSAGLIVSEIRATNNYAAAIMEDEPRRAYETYKSGLDLARRVGNRGYVSWLSFTTASSAFVLGEDWDERIEDLDDAIAESRDPSDEVRVRGFRLVLQVARGAPSVGEDMVRLEELTGRLSDPAPMAGRAINRSDRALLEGRFDEAFDEAMSAVETFSATGPFAYPIAFRAGLWAGDRSRVEAATKGFDSHPDSGAAIRATRTVMQAGLAALEGRIPEAIHGFLEAIADLRRLGLRFEVARVQLDFVIAVGPRVREARDAAEEARATFERLGTKPYLDRLERALATEPPTARPGSPTADESSAVTA